MLALLVGGARSGKSDLAVRLAMARGGPVTFIATAQALDEEMSARIAAHRAARPVQWLTVEEPLQLQAALSSGGRARTVILDCLTLWVANLLGSGASDADVLSRASDLAASAADGDGLVLVVSNEVGAGIVPADPLTRRYRDLLGEVNVLFAGAAEEAFLVVAGRLLSLERPALASGRLLR
ncbi:MAG TPA: bifunctional adenosylcobinamide kinase/adenosylcobinamide-phosphate guanylyltransferase [Acidimicrobiales bacterium]|nr:bifunctional adenosylcobinamide kinase/adenosylcobinamide-phosphate guanylyltransferase [Acidimicrobiales bacterium]